MSDQVVYAGGNPCFDERTGTYTCGPNAPAPAAIPSWVKWAALGLLVLLVLGNE